MFDFFGRKRIAELTQANENLQRRLKQWEDEWDVSSKELIRAYSDRDSLIKRIRDMDQLIFLMSQKTSWEEQRPYFLQLLEGTNSRMRIESDRIRDVLIPEIRQTYTNDTLKPVSISASKGDRT